jgi:thiamine kinase-like enzyme
MNINLNKKGGDDLYNNRLFSYLSKKLGLNIIELKQLRGNVYFVKTERMKFIVKGYKDLKKLKVQEAFTSSLRKAGFPYSYTFYTNSKEPLYYQDKYLGCMEFIESADDPFHYKNKEDRNAGIELLNLFHLKTGNLSSSYSGLIPKVNLARKWQQRKKEFIHNLPKVHYYIGKDITHEFIKWADFSVNGFEKLKSTIDDSQPAILHGDVAHHNFLRSKDGTLNIIDFDLISIGSPAYDMLQYSNRILPFLDWKLEELASVKHLNNWLNSEAFLYGLLYPADLLREWNRIIRDGNHSNPYRTAPIVEMTLSQLQQRQHFQQEIRAMLP